MVGKPSLSWRCCYENVNDGSGKNLGLACSKFPLCYVPSQYKILKINCHSHSFPKFNYTVTLNTYHFWFPTPPTSPTPLKFPTSGPDIWVEHFLSFRMKSKTGSNANESNQSKHFLICCYFQLNRLESKYSSNFCVIRCNDVNKCYATIILSECLSIA